MDFLTAIETATRSIKLWMLKKLESDVKPIAAETASLKQEIDTERSRIDNLAKLEQGSTTGDAELIDARVGFDSKSYNNTGNAIRTQAKMLFEEIQARIASLQNGKIEYDIGPVTVGGQIGADNGIFVIKEDKGLGATEHFIPMHIGEVYTVSSGGCRFNLYFYDKDKNFIKAWYNPNNTKTDTVTFENTQYHFARIACWRNEPMTQDHFDTISFGIKVDCDTFEKIQARISKIQEMTEELTDIRVGFDFKRYETASDAVRDQVSMLYEEIKSRVASLQNGKIEYDIGPVTVGGQIGVGNGIFVIKEDTGLGATEHFIPLHIGETYTVSSSGCRFNLYFYDQKKNYLGAYYNPDTTKTETVSFVNTEYHFVRIGCWRNAPMTQEHFDTISLSILVSNDTFEQMRALITDVDGKIQYNGWIDCRGAVEIDTEAKTLTLGEAGHICFGGKRYNVAGRAFDISSMMNGAFVYFDPDTITLETSWKKGRAYLGAMWRPAGLTDLHVTRGKLVVDGMPVTYTGRFMGKTVNCLGDSMTYGTGTTKAYHQWLRQLCGFSTTAVYGVGGSCIAPKVDAVPSWETGIKSFYERYSNMGDADAVIVFGCVNDWVTGRTLGTLADTGTDTFYGAMKALCEGLISKYPTGDIYIFSSPQNDYISRPANNLGGTEWEGNTEGYNRKGHKLQDYANAMREVCAVYGIPFCSLTDSLFWGLSGVLGDNNGTSGIYGSDALHPNAEGHKKIALRIADFINSSGNAGCAGKVDNEKFEKYVDWKSTKLSREYENGDYILALTYHTVGSDVQSGKSKILMYLSSDGVNFSKVGVLPANVDANLYDLSTIYHNGKWIIAYDRIDRTYNDWTDENNSYNRGGNRVGILTTTDFVNFTNQYLDLPTAWKSTWAPEVFVDNDKLYIALTTSTCTETYTKTTGGIRYVKDGIYICKLNDDFSLAEYTEITLPDDGITPENYIDASVYKKDGTYYLAIKEENYITQRLYKSSSLLGGYELVHEFDEMGEGMAIVEFNGKYYAYSDKFVDAGMTQKRGTYLSVSDDMESWSSMVLVNNQGDAWNRHFTPCVVTTDEQKSSISNFVKLMGSVDTTVESCANKSYLLAQNTEVNVIERLLLQPNAVYYVINAGQVTVNSVDTSLMKHGDTCKFLVTGRNTNKKITFKFSDDNNLYWGHTNDLVFTKPDGTITITCTHGGDKKYCYADVGFDETDIKKIHHKATISFDDGLSLHLIRNEQVVTAMLRGTVTSLTAFTEVVQEGVLPEWAIPPISISFGNNLLNADKFVNGFLQLNINGNVSYCSDTDLTNKWFAVNATYQVN